MKSANGSVLKLFSVTLLMLFVTMAILAAGCTSELSDKDSPDKQNEEIKKDKFSTKHLTSRFADYEEIPVNVEPAVNNYEIKSDLSNITNRDMFKLSPKAQVLLQKNGFVVVPGKNREFFPLYEMNRYRPVPSFITTDSMLHNYHLFFDHLLRVIEKEKLQPELKNLTIKMLEESIEQYRELKGTTWENAAKRNIGFFAVVGKLLDPTMEVPGIVEEVVTEELDLIKEHQGITLSPLMNLGQDYGISEGLKEDYSQYIPRGHYNNDSLRQYFKAMMWYGRITFRLKSEDETRSAVLITLALNKGNNLVSWEKIYNATKFFVGKSDDISYNQYIKLLRKIYGTEVELQELASNDEKWNRFISEANNLQSPFINSMPIFDESINPDREREIKGFRFMGQRFTLDAFVFQRLVYREVGDRDNKRMLPKGLDIPAAFGSEEAYTILEEMGETNYKNYSKNMAKLRKYIDGLDKKTWTHNLYWGWLYSLKPLTVEKGEGYPSFMQNTAWARKELATFLGSWTELKHDTILYAKQVYAEMGGGASDEDDRGYVEPNPELYSRLASLVRMTRQGLFERNLLNQRDEESLKRLEQLAISLKNISEKELAGKSLTDEEYELIRSYGGQLEHFWLEALRDEGIDHPSALADRPAALVADVATNPEGTVLEEATGYIYEIYAVVPVEGKLRIARGGVYSYYEFPWPLHDRLTDEKWRDILDNDQAPPLPEWTQKFIADETS